MRAVSGLALAPVLALTLAGCGLLRVDASPTPGVVTHTDPYPANPTGEWDAILVVASPDEGGGPEVSVDEAVSSTSDPLLVRGALFVDDAYGQVWLCSRVELSDDTGGPRCGGTILLVQDESGGAGLRVSDYIASLLAAGTVINLRPSGATVRWSADAAFRGRIE